MLDLIKNPEIRKHAGHFAPGEYLFHDGDPGDSVFILIKGKLDVLKGDKVISTISGHGTIFGEVSFLLESPRTATVAARTEAEVISLPNARVAGIWEKFPEFAVELTRILARRLADTTDLAHGFREFCDRMPDAVVMTDPKLKIVSWNQAAEKLYGRDWREMRNRPLSDCHDDQASLNFFLDQVNREQTVREKLLKVNHPDNPWCFASISGTALRDQNGAVRNYILLARDASEHTMREKKYRRLTVWLPLVCLALLLSTVAIFYPADRNKTDEPTAISRLFLERLKTDSIAIELALEINGRGKNMLKRIFRRFIKIRRPQAMAITAIILRDRRGRVIACRDSATGKDCDQKNDPGFIEPAGLDRSHYNLYMSQDKTGQRIEIMRPFAKNQWLSFQLDPGVLRNRFNLSPADLRGLPLE